jgi:two-component system, OmpR family, response regulator
MRALVVEDDPAVAADVAHALRAAGFAVDVATDGEDAWYRGDVEEYDVIVLDLGLPRLDGLSVLKRWRTSDRFAPVLILSAREDWTEKVEGIEAGADDYLGKPFEMAELIARVRALVRRAAGRASAVIRIGRLTVDTRRLSVSVDAREIRLSPLEFRLIDYLAHQPDRAVPAGELAEHLYGTADAIDTNAIEALVARLRRKVGAQLIATRRGFGYLIDGNAP